MKLLFIGYRGSGKTTAAEFLGRTANTGDLLCELLAHRYKIRKEFIAEHKNEFREALWMVGRELQSCDPAILCRIALGNLLQRETNDPHMCVTGVRNQDELLAARNLFDRVIWVDRNGVTPHPNELELGPADADVTIRNNGTFSDLREECNRVFYEAQTT